MALSSDLISQFVKVTKDETKNKTETTLYGTVVRNGDSINVQLDGSNVLTPVSTTTNVKNGERVTVLVKDHTAIITGNVSSPAARTGEVEDLSKRVNEFDEVVTGDLRAVNANIESLVADNAVIKGQIKASEAKFGELEAADATITGQLTAANADIEKLKTDKLDATTADITYATIKNLEATNAELYNLNATYGEFHDLTTQKFEAVDAQIATLDADKLNAKEAALTYANIDFSNINEAAVEKLFTDSGIIKDLVVSEGKITGELVGVTIKGDLIEGNTIVADKLVVKGQNGLYYKLNTNGVTTEAEQTDYNSLNGTVIQAKSITAEKIAVDDLVAFGATIGGFNITTDALYSGVKNGVLNTTRGIYMDKTGQFSVGDSNNYLRYFKDETTGQYKLQISAGSIEMSASGKTLEDEIADLRDEITTLLCIESSRGNVFKNDSVSTVLSAVVYRGNQRITDMVTLKKAMGNDVYLEWSWQRLDDQSFGVISADDSHIGNDGFTFTLSPDDVDTKVTFLCQLITPDSK